jgi:GH15 family glucan-1,4-alpha-glucosidase
VRSLNLAVIGNCSISALLDDHGRIVWCCLPRFDGDPVFSALVNDGSADSQFSIELPDTVRTEQRYWHNSAIVETVFHSSSDSAIELVDFAPRFKQFGRTFRPNMIVRRVRPVSGTPQITVRLRPTYGYGGHSPQITRGSNHARFVMPDMTLRLTTDAPVTYVLDEATFILDRTLTFILGPDESLTHSVGMIARDFQESTDHYWREWCRYLSIPFEWQEAVIRAAITLKLCNFEETGAVVAAMTTSIPESSHSGRNWDYRYCWLRDAFHVVHALNRLGVTRTMEGYLSYINNIVATSASGYLQPVYGIGLERHLAERDEPNLAGYRNMGPVRVGNMAHSQVQNDGYGSVILACAQSFFDQRLIRHAQADDFERLQHLGEQAVARWNQPDAGPWELRTRARVHTYSSLLCWAACDRLGRIAAQLRQAERAHYWHRHASAIHASILESAWSAERGCFIESFGGTHLDASLLLMPMLGFLPAEDERFVRTMSCIADRLKRGRYILRYEGADDLGMPETGFLVCTFWYIDALAAVGRMEEARELFEGVIDCRNALGLLSEDADTETGELWGNFPQTYSMVGLINSAMRLSKPWEDAF